MNNRKNQKPGIVSYQSLVSQNKSGLHSLFQTWTPESLKNIQKIYFTHLTSENIRKFSNMVYPPWLLPQNGSFLNGNAPNTPPRQSNDGLIKSFIRCNYYYAGAMTSSFSRMAKKANNTLNYLGQIYFHSEAAKFVSLMVITPPSVALSVSSAERKKILNHLNVSSTLSIMSRAYWETNWQFLKQSTAASYLKNILTVTGNNLKTSGKEAAHVRPIGADSATEINLVKESMSYEAEEAQAISNESKDNVLNSASKESGNMLKILGITTGIGLADTLVGCYWGNKKTLIAINKPIPPLNVLLDKVKFTGLGFGPSFGKRWLNAFLILGMDDFIKEPMNRVFPPNHYPLVSSVATIGLSGFIFGVVSNPFEIANKYMVANADLNKLTTKSMWETVKTLTNEQGYQALWRGTHKNISISIRAYFAIQLSFMGVNYFFEWGQSRFKKAKAHDQAPVSSNTVNVVKIEEVADDQPKKTAGVSTTEMMTKLQAPTPSAVKPGAVKIKMGEKKQKKDNASQAANVPPAVKQESSLLGSLSTYMSGLMFTRSGGQAESEEMKKQAQQKEASEINNKPKI